MSSLSSAAGTGRRRLVFAVLAMVALGLGFKQFGRETASAAIAPPQDLGVPVVLQQVQRQDLPISLQAIGSVQALNSVNVRVRADGELQKVFFTEGQMVTAGSKLAQIDARVYEAVAAQAKAVVAKDQAQLTNLRVNLDRADKLAQAKAGPVQDAENFRAQLAAQQALVEADQAALENARIQLGFTKVTAPLTGRTGQRQLDVGAIVHGVDATGLVTITQMNPISVAFAVPQDALPAILRDNAKQALTVLALSRDGRETIASGHLSFIDSQVTAGSGQILLKAEFDNSAQQLWPGQLVSAKVLLRTEKDATVVPANAVELGQKGSFVYVVDDKQQAQPRPVVASTIVDGKQWIRDGLQPGETVVVQGQSRIAPGVKVVAQ